MINELFEQKTMQLTMYKDGKFVEGSSDDIELLIYGDEKTKYIDVELVQNGYKYKFFTKAHKITKIEN